MSSGRDEYLSRQSENNVHTQKKYRDFEEWFKLILPSLWNERDTEWSNTKVKNWLEEAFEAGRKEMYLKGPEPGVIKSVTVTTTGSGWPEAKPKYTL